MKHENVWNEDTEELCEDVRSMLGKLRTDHPEVPLDRLGFIVTATVMSELNFEMLYGEEE